MKADKMLCAVETVMALIDCVVELDVQFSLKCFAGLDLCLCAF